MATAKKAATKTTTKPATAKRDTSSNVEVKPGGSVRITINKTVNRAAAKKTLERLFMMDKTVRAPMEMRSRNFKELPKRRGGQIWTKRPNKLHPELVKGASATVMATPQHIRDLRSVADFVEVKTA